MDDMDFIHVDPEDVQVERWRIEQLDAMGFSPLQSRTLEQAGVDLHDAENLLARGCPVEFAVTILT